MLTRTTTRTVRFNFRFTLTGVDEPQPAGDYKIETDEEQIDSTFFIGYRRTATFIYLPSQPGHRNITQLVRIEPDELDLALRNDHDAYSRSPTVVGSN